MREREVADVADHEVVAERERCKEARENENVQQVALLAGKGGGHDPRQRHEDGAAQRPRDRPARAQMPIRRPKRPCGRHRSTAIMKRKAKASLYAYDT